MSRRLWVAPALSALLALGACGRGVIGGAPPPPSGASGLAAAMFVAQYGYGPGDTGGGHGTFLSLFDESTGAHVRDLVHLAEGSPIHLGGYARAAHGDIWYVLSRGPYHLGHVENGAPKPGTCGGTVYRLDHLTGQAHEVFRVGADRTISSPALSHDGTLLAYTSEACDATFHDAVIVRDLARATEHRIAVADAAAGSPTWSHDDRRLVFDVFFSVQNSHADDPGFVVVNAETSGKLTRAAVIHAPDRGCVAVRTAFDRTGIALIEGCPDQVTPPAALMQLDATGRRVLWRAQTGLCPNGASLVPDATGTKLLVTATNHCGNPDPIIDIVQAWEGRHSHELGRYVTPSQFVDGAAW